MKKLLNKKTVQFAVKLVVTSAALIFVMKKINLQLFLQTLVDINPWFFLLGLIMFNLSKIVSAFRLNSLYRLAGTYLNNIVNLRFYYLGMFYNMFLPGSIGGDAFKVYLLKQNNQEASVKKLVAASLLDRMSGVSLLTIMGGLFLYLSSFHTTYAYYEAILFGGIALIIPAYYLLVKIAFPTFLPAFNQMGVYSFFVQLGQVCSALLLLEALHIEAFQWDYLTLFMISSVFAIIPLTIGGAGARELVFIFGASYLQVDQASAVAFAILFFCISAISSLSGLSFIISIDKKISTGTTTHTHV